ncbi:MAG: hypothetical protein H0A76_12770 [Candidatus Thiodubiliella endoseptemdiera]|uniref:Uncharacterized protein n=1 Tax=Candidatus Thiodubiliella endoseptemdiera TaxID=2738886 RepID=A0A853F3P5_9GAMM|nr:hypothetical protein [Candidatus Thiodubiliella endoseptemdiera]
MGIQTPFKDGGAPKLKGPGKNHLISKIWGLCPRAIGYVHFLKSEFSDLLVNLCKTNIFRPGASPGASPFNRIIVPSFGLNAPPFGGGFEGSPRERPKFPGVWVAVMVESRVPHFFKFFLF